MELAGCSKKCAFCKHEESVQHLFLIVHAICVVYGQIRHSFTTEHYWYVWQLALTADMLERPHVWAALAANLGATTAARGQCNGALSAYKIGLFTSYGWQSRFYTSSEDEDHGGDGFIVSPHLLFCWTFQSNILITGLCNRYYFFRRGVLMLPETLFQRCKPLWLYASWMQMLCGESSAY